MSRVVSGLLVCVYAACAALTPQQKKQNIESFEHVWKTIKDKHWDTNLVGESWQKAHDEFRVKVEQAETQDAVRAALNEMIGRLKQTHFGVVPADLYSEMDNPSASKGEGDLGLQVRVLGDQALVTEVLPNSAAEGAGVRPGWQILAINGRPVAPVLARMRKTLGDSTLLDVSLERSIANRLKGAVGSKIKVEFRDAADQPTTLELATATPRGARVRFGFMPTMFITHETKRLGEDVEYLRFSAFLDPANLMPALSEAIQTCMNCKGMVIDLRGNPGGIGVMAMGLGGWFIDKPNQKLGTMYMRDNELNFVITSRPQTFAGKLAILVDGSSGSTSEIFAGGMKDLKRATVFGTRTAGAALPSTFERLPNGDGFQYAIANYVSESGRPLEGVGVIPDVEVKLTRAALLAGRDPVLETAVDWIHGK